MGEPQTIDSKRADEVQARIDAARDYLANVVAKDADLRPLLGQCKLQHKDCAFWATLGKVWLCLFCQYYESSCTYSHFQTS